MGARNVNLTDMLDGFVEEQVASGAFQNASEVVRAGLRLLKSQTDDHAARLARLRAAIQVGVDEIERGEGIEVTDIDAFFDELSAEVEAEFK